MAALSLVHPGRLTTPPPADGSVGQTRHVTDTGILGSARVVVAFFRTHPRLTKAIQAALVAATVGLCAWAIVDQWHKAGPRLAHARPGYLAAAFLMKGDEFAHLIKMGRTQLQDAVPMTLGQEFTAFAHTMLEDIDRLTEAQALIREINMGATAIGTRINTPPGYAEVVCRELSRITGLPLITAPDLVEATADTGAFVQLSGVLKRCAVKLSKICNDLRLLSSGPRAGLGEINLPPMQPGSSIMPGKVNPVIPEVVNQVCFDVIGGDVSVTLAAEAGQLQLNVFEPVIAYRLLRSIEMMKNGCVVLRQRCVEGISANPGRMRQFVEHSIGIVTALVPVIGYEHATAVAKEALESGRGVYEIVMSRGLLTREQLDEVLDPEKMIGRG